MSDRQTLTAAGAVVVADDEVLMVRQRRAYVVDWVAVPVGGERRPDVAVAADGTQTYSLA